MNMVIYTCDHCKQLIDRHEQTRVVYTQKGHYFYHVKPDCYAEAMHKEMRERLNNLNRHEEWADV